MSQPQSLRAATRHAHSAHGLLDAGMDRTRRHDQPRHDNAFHRAAVVQGSLPGEENEAEIAVAQILRLGQSRAIGIRHNRRLYQRECHEQPLAEKGSLGALAGHIARRQFVMHRTRLDHGVRMVKGASA